MSIEETLAPVFQPTSPTAGLQHAIQDGSAQERLRTLLRRISEWQHEKVVQELLPEINAVRTVSVRTRHQRLRELFRDHEQKIFNLLKFGIQGARTRFAENASTAPLASALDRLVASDPNSLTGITQEAMCALELGIAALIGHINNLLDHGELRTEELKLLLSGGPGAAIVTEAAIRPLIMLLPT